MKGNLRVLEEKKMYDLELLKEAIIRADNGIDSISIDLDLKLLKNSVLDDMI